MDAQAADPWTEPGPPPLPAEGPGTDRASLPGSGDARPLLQGDVLDLVELRHERVTGGQRLDAVTVLTDVKEGHPGTVCTGDGP